MTHWAEYLNLWRLFDNTLEDENIHHIGRLQLAKDYFQSEYLFVMK